MVADTVRSDRKDIFSFSPTDQHHVGTLVSGSRKYLDRFERQVALIRRSPEMHDLLIRLVREARYNDINALRISDLAHEAQAILTEIEAPYQEG